MNLKVRFRYNVVTGAVEVFDMDDVGESGLSVSEHNRRHDDSAANLARAISPSASFHEVFPSAQPAGEPGQSSGEDETQTESGERRRDRQ